MNRLLKVAEFCYGEETRHRVFEPMFADCDREIRGDRSWLTRVRWWSAFVAAFVACLPRATVGNLSVRFAADVAARGLGFFAVAFALQWLMGFRRQSPTAWTPSFATTFYFIIAPVILRIRYEAIGIHQQRLLTLAFSTACLVIAWISLSPAAAPGAALLFGTAWMTVFSWRLYTNLRGERLSKSRVFTLIYPAAGIIVASMPVKLALGISWWRPWWAGDNMTAYVIGALIAITAKGVEVPDAPYRKFLQ